MGIVTLLLTEPTSGITGYTQGSLWLSLLMPLFSGFVGGLVVLYIQIRQRNKKEDKERNQELKGLLRILDLEMAKNDSLLQGALAVEAQTASGSELQPLLEVRNLETRDWDSTKVRLARLAGAEHFKNLDTYYRNVRDLSAFVQRLYNQSSFPTHQKTRAHELTQQCKAASDAARQESRRILNTS